VHRLLNRRPIDARARRVIAITEANHGRVLKRDGNAKVIQVRPILCRARLPHGRRTYRAAPVTVLSTAAEVPTVTMPIADWS
jgi:hypothetical protein